VGDLQGLELGELSGIPNLGVGTLDLILRVLAEAAASSAMQALPPIPHAVREHFRSSVVPAVNKSGHLVAILDDLSKIARWHVAAGTDSLPLLDPEPASGTPAAIVDARRRLDLIRAADVLDDDAARLDAAALVRQSISQLDERKQLVVTRRLFADQPETLEQLGAQLSLTRERVRQIESKAKASMVKLLQSGGPLELVAQATRDLIGNVLPLDALLERLPALARIVEPVGQPVWRILDRLDDRYEIGDTWCASPTVLAARVATHARLEELADPYGVVRLDDLGSLNPHLDHGSHEALVAWLRDSGCVLHDDFVLTRTQSLGDRAAAVLSIVGAPLSPEEILDNLRIGRSVSALKNAMSVDERIARVDRDRWALVEWGLDSYTSVRALVKDEIARNGGKVTMDVLVEGITSRYSVTASSVIAYASALPFQCSGGVVRLSAGPREHSKTPQKTRRLYRRKQSWLYRVQITKDHLRGSGSAAPLAIAGILQLKFGETRLLESRLGSQVISWTALQPSFGSIRRLLIDDDIAIDTELFLVIGDDGTFDVEAVAVPTGDPLTDALALIGIAAQKPTTKSRELVGQAVGLAETASTSDIITAYRDRGDNDVADLLVLSRAQLGDGVHTSQSTESSDIDDILDLL
jgi:hypothetical protein